MVAILIGTLLGFTGAFGTGEISAFKRISYFILVSLTGDFFAFLIAFFLDKWLDCDERPIIYHIIFLFGLSAPTCFGVLALGNLFFGFPINFKNYIGFLPAVLFISFFFTIIHAMLDKVPLQTHQNISNKIERPKLIEKLPIKYRNAQIFAIKSEDHYLRIYTSLGEELMLYRLSDAIIDLDGIEGVQTHRSWWVAIDAIENSIKDYGKNKFLIKNQIEVPISRSYIKAIKQLNLI